MTDEKINAAIAEACGWKCAGHPDQLKATDGFQFGYQVVMRPDGQLVTHNSIPDYCADLNAMHEAEEEILKEWANGCDLWLEYTHHLMLLCSAHLTEHATARQRAEAFLKTVGKWEEVQK